MTHYEISHFYKSPPLSFLQGQRSPCPLSGKIKEYILKEIIPTGFKKKKKKSARKHNLLIRGKAHSILVIDVLFPAQRCLLYCLSHSNELLQCFSKIYTTFQINTLHAKKVVDIQTGVLQYSLTKQITGPRH